MRMTKKKKTWIIIGAVGGTIYLMLMIVLAAGFPWILMYIGYQFEEDPPQPVVSYAEFPFELVYEINGERIEIKDTLVIEYKGTDWNEGIGKYIEWDAYCKSQIGTDRDYRSYMFSELRMFDGYSAFYKDDVEILFALGSCEYYMGIGEVAPADFYYRSYDLEAGDFLLFSSSYTGPINDEELYKSCGIKIIKKSISPPINPEDYS